MDKKEIVERLNKITEGKQSDVEKSHVEADGLLLAFINDEDIELAYSKVDKWYA